MSAPLAAKFQDHYAVLGIGPKSDSDTIQRAYAKLAQKYYPNNSTTSDPEMFEAVDAAPGTHCRGDRDGIEFRAVVPETARPGIKRRQEQPADHRGRHGFSRKP